MKKFLRWLDINFEPLCMTVMIYLMSGLMVLQVILRFAFHTGFAWGEEVSRFIFVWLYSYLFPMRCGMPDTLALTLFENFSLSQ